MKHRMKLHSLLAKLPDAMREGIIGAIKDEGLDPDELSVKRNTATEAPNELDEGSRTAVQYVSTAGLDRDKEILIPRGAQMAEFKKAPQVLWGHDYSMPPIGSDDSIKADSHGLLATTRYSANKFPSEIFTLKQEGHLKTSSVGFVTLSAVEPGDDGFDTTLNSLAKNDPSLEFKGDEVRRIIKKWLLLEHSDVSVPANIEALTIAVSKGQTKLSARLLDDFDIKVEDEPEPKPHVSKRAIPFKDTGIAPIDTAWDGPSEIREADTAKLRVMAAWFDAENPELKSSFKLPHHTATSPHRTIWRGLVAAMGALLGARGGVDIPISDRRPVYNHLARHYEQFDREPPEFRSHTADEIKLWMDEPESTEIIKLVTPAPVVKPVTNAPQVVRLVRAAPAAPQSTDEIIVEKVQLAVDMATGRV